MHKQRISGTDLRRFVHTLRAALPHGSTRRVLLSLSRFQTQPKRHEGSRGKATKPTPLPTNCLARTISTFFRDCFPLLERRGRVPAGGKGTPSAHSTSGQLRGRLSHMGRDPPPTQMSRSPCQPATTQHLPERHPAVSAPTPRPGALCPPRSPGGREVCDAN